jgi:hypothetical protein
LPGDSDVVVVGLVVVTAIVVVGTDMVVGGVVVDAGSDALDEVVVGSASRPAPPHATSTTMTETPTDANASLTI